MSCNCSLCPGLTTGWLPLVSLDTLHQTWAASLSPAFRRFHDAGKHALCPMLPITYRAIEWWNEGWPRDFNNSLTWTDELPLILLAIRATHKEDLGCAPEELTYGTTLHLLGELIDPAANPTSDDQQTFLFRLRATQGPSRMAQPSTMSHPLCRQRGLFLFDTMLTAPFLSNYMTGLLGCSGAT